MLFFDKNDGDARQALRVRGVQVQYPGVGMGAPERHAGERAGELEIVDEYRGPRDFLHGVDDGMRPADDARAHEPPPSVHPPGGGRYRLENLLVPRAAAKVSREAALYLFARGRGVLIQKRLRRYDDSGRAESTLHAAFFDELLLHRMKVVFGSDAAHGDDIGAVRLRGEHEAGVHR